MTGALNWTGGTMQGSSGATNVPLGSTLNQNSAFGATLSGRTFNLAGTGAIAGPGCVALDSGAVFNNNSTLELRSDAAIAGSGGTTFNNTGTLRKQARPAPQPLPLRLATPARSRFARAR